MGRHRVREVPAGPVRAGAARRRRRRWCRGRWGRVAGGAIGNSRGGSAGAGRAVRRRRWCSSLVVGHRERSQHGGPPRVVSGQSTGPVTGCIASAAKVTSDEMTTSHPSMSMQLGGGPEVEPQHGAVGELIAGLGGLRAVLALLCAVEADRGMSTLSSCCENTPRNSAPLSDTKSIGCDVASASTGTPAAWQALRSPAHAQPTKTRRHGRRGTRRRPGAATTRRHV